MADETSPSRGFKLFDFAIGRVSSMPVQTLLQFSLPEIGEDLAGLRAAEARLQRAKAELTELLHSRVGQCQDRLKRGALLKLKRRVGGGQRDSLEADGLEGDVELDGRLAELNAALSDLRSRSQSAEMRFMKLTAERRTAFARFLEDPFFLETVLLSSEQLLQALVKYRAEPPAADPDKSARQTERALFQHLARCCLKTTPRATLTSVHLGRLDGEPSAMASVESRAAAPHSGSVGGRRTRLALPVLDALCEEALQAPDAWKSVTPRLNPTLHQEGGTHYRFWSTDPGAEPKLLSLPVSDLLSFYVAQARTRERDAGEIVRAAQESFPDFSDDEHASYYRKLGEIGLLFARLEIPLSEADPLGFLLRWCLALPERSRPAGLIDRLRRLQSLLAGLDSGSAPRGPGAYAEIGVLLGRDPAAAATPDQALVVDSTADWNGFRLGGRALEAIQHALSLMSWFTGRESVLTRVRRTAASRLQDRFNGRSVLPAIELLPAHPDDPSWLDGMFELRRNPAFAAKLESLGAAWAQGRLPDGRQSAMPVDGLQGCVTFQVAREDEELLLVLGEEGGNLARSWARFVPLFPDGLSSELRAALARHCAAYGLNRPGSLVAGAIFRAAKRSGSVNSQPTLREHELEISHGRSALGADRILTLDQLELRAQGTPDDPDYGLFRGDQPVSVIYDGLAHHGLPWLRFLEIADPKRGWLVFPRQNSLMRAGKNPEVTRAPRLRSGDVVLLRESWSLDAEVLNGLLSPSSAWLSFEAFDRWRVANGIPRFFFAYSANHAKWASPRPLDALNPFLMEGFFSDLRNWPHGCQVGIQEMLPSPEQLWIRDQAGQAYAQEFTIGYESFEKARAPELALRGPR